MVFYHFSRHSDPEERNTSSESVGKGCDHKVANIKYEPSIQNNA